MALLVVGAVGQKLRLGLVLRQATDEGIGAALDQVERRAVVGQRARLIHL